MSLSLRFAAGSHVGMIRDHNEDSGYAGPRLLAIADGMGGQAAGEVASSEVISTLVQLDDDIPGSDILTSLDVSVQRANSQLRAMVHEDPRLDGMGTTLTALLWTGQRLGVVHVGDSRAYLLRDGELTQITQDHTWVQRLVDEGRITEEEATTHPQRSLLMRALGSADHIEADLSIREVRPGDRYLLCSDGLSGVVSADTLRDTLGAFHPPHDTVRELIELALRGGGPDNVTCIVADVLDVDVQVGDTLARQLYDAPQIVGAVAEVQTQSTGETPRTPAARAAELGRPPAPPAAPGPPTGVFGAFTDEDYLPSKRGRAWKRSALIVLALAVVGGGLYAGYRWTQTQYYIAANGDHVALYQGISQQLGPLSLSSVAEDYPDIQLELLPTYKREQVEGTISADSLGAAETRITELSDQAEACRLLAEQREAEQQQDDASGGDDGKTDPGEQPPAPEAPTMTEEQQELARQCTT
ncbi:MULTISPECIES: protein phosphatase 2C domain-containing protein [unclassified Streptomyces]|uniref:Protein phosphatase 2C domain-containing protein n=1 Tax=Streptomyces millisiae TaxID=3075542 RepID=A0ABU2LM64_9ACTN|nr:protein phosphatase 2C domain-containing protein [Streptomyces sp. DSM 44918]MDT0318148.1 protein phosphatase 2C domain-containing protein [Streptomyces sp. DSM 44918]